MAKTKQHGGQQKPSQVKDMKQWRKEQKEKKRRFQEAMQRKQEDGTWTKTRPEPKTESKDKKAKKKKGKAKPEAEVEAEIEQEEEVELPKKKQKRKNAEEDAQDEEAEPPKKKQKNKKAEAATEAAAETADEPTEKPVKTSKKRKKQQEEDEEAEEAEPPVEDPEAFKIVVAGIPMVAEEKVVRKHFSQCGEILSLRLLRDRETGNSRGIAFISFMDQASLDAALELDGSDFRGRALAIQVAKKNSKGGKGSGKAKVQGPGKKPEGCRSVIIKGLAYSVTEADLKKTFKKCGGGPEDVKILTDRDTGASRGMAFLDFSSESAVDEAIALNGTILKGRRFTMDYATPRW